MTAALDIVDLCKHFGSQLVVDHLSFRVEAGEIFGLLGPNGAGKSTTINMIAGGCRIGSGAIRVFGQPVLRSARRSRAARYQLGVMHQELIADPFFTIHQALQLQPGFYGTRLDPHWYAHIIERLALTPYLHKPVNHLSGGTKRRFMLAKALIHKPALLILDEPSAGVDLELRHSLWQFIRDVNRSGTTVLLTTHYLEEAEQMCQRVAILKQGRLVALDATERLKQQIQQRQLHVSLSRPLLAIPPALMPWQPQLSSGGRALQLRLPAETSVCLLLTQLQQLGLDISDFDTSGPTLEDVFLHLTRDAASAKTTGAPHVQ
jgi:ABC-2 type transport system ATP-binding protein